MAMDINVFYAWQDDLPKEICRDLIRSAAQGARDVMNTDKPEYHVILDEGPLGAPGMCDIPNTILKKIKECDIFLCDLTFVGSYTNRSSTQKKVSNPNVYFEFGFAVAHLGFRRVIGVMNTAYGKPKDQVFDVKRRWALRYNLPCGADAAAQECARSQLTEKIADALRTVLEKSPSRKRVQRSATRFQQIRESFESEVSESRFHDLISERAILAVCLIPDRAYRLDRNSIHGRLRPLLHEARRCQWETDRHSEISVVKCSPWKSVLDVNSEGVVRAASTLAITEGVPSRDAADFFGPHRAEHLIRATSIQRTLVYSLRLWAAVLREWEVAGPFRLGVSLLAVQDWDLLVNDQTLCNRPQKEPALSADPITFCSLADFDDAQVLFQTLKPAFDDIARGFGLREWPAVAFGAGG